MKHGPQTNSAKNCPGFSNFRLVEFSNRDILIAILAMIRPVTTENSASQPATSRVADRKTTFNRLCWCGAAGLILLAGVVFVDWLAVAPGCPWGLSVVFLVLFGTTHALQQTIPAT